MSGARADQANVTLDGVDNNDPLYNTAYTGALRSTLDSLQEFRVTTSNYGAESGRSCAAQVSLVTKSGTNVTTGRVTDVIRRTATSTNEYFLKLRSCAGRQRCQSWTRTSTAGRSAAPVKDKLFFFGNYERLREDSEALADAQVPSLSMRDGVMVYQCADRGGSAPAERCGVSRTATPSRPGFYGATPRSSPASTRSGIGPSRSASELFQAASRAKRRRARRLQLMGYKFRAPFRTHSTRHRARRLPAGGQPELLRPLQLPADTLNGRAAVPGTGPAAEQTHQIKSWGSRSARTRSLGSTLVNTFRYGFTKIVHDTIGTADRTAVYFRFIDDLNEARSRSSSGRRTPDAQLRQRHDVAQGQPHGQVRRQPAIHPHPQLHRMRTRSATAAVQPLMGRRRRREIHARVKPAATCRAVRRFPLSPTGWNWADA